MKTYTISKGTKIYRAIAVGVPDDLDGPWDPIVSTREVTYTDEDLRITYKPGNRWYIFNLPAIAHPYNIIAVDLERVSLTWE